jgi:hypothetical protein
MIAGLLTGIMEKDKQRFEAQISGPEKIPGQAATNGNSITN